MQLTGEGPLSPLEESWWGETLGWAWRMSIISQMEDRSQRYPHPEEQHMPMREEWAPVRLRKPEVEGGSATSVTEGLRLSSERKADPALGTGSQDQRHRAQHLPSWSSQSLGVHRSLCSHTNNSQGVGVGKTGKGQKIQTFSYEINKSWGMMYSTATTVNNSVCIFEIC